MRQMPHTTLQTLKKKNASALKEAQSSSTHIETELAQDTLSLTYQESRVFLLPATVSRVQSPGGHLLQGARPSIFAAGFTAATLLSRRLCAGYRHSPIAWLHSSFFLRCHSQ